MKKKNIKKNLSYREGSLEDFRYAYSLMEEYFPVCELKSWDILKDLIFIKRDSFYQFYIVSYSGIDVGFFLSCKDKDTGKILIDYLYIYQNYRSQGYGSLIIEDFKFIFNEYNGCFFEVEKQDQNNPITLKRSKFYNKSGVYKLNFHYFYPGKDFSFTPMDLYYLSFNQKNLSKSDILKSVNNFFNLIHYDNNENCYLLLNKMSNIN